MPLDAHGKQSGSEYHGYYRRRVFLPLFATVGETGDVLAADLRQGNKHEVTDCAGFVVSMEQKARTHLANKVYFRMDAGFNSGELYDDLERVGVNYLMRLRKNKRPEALTKRYIGDRRSEDTWYDDIEYGADSWGCDRRIIVVVKPLRDERVNKLYYLVTNLPKETHPAEDLAPMYPRRGNAKRYQGEMHAACPLLLSSSPRPKSHYRNNPIERDDSTDTEGTEVSRSPKRKRNTLRYTRRTTHDSKSICLCTNSFTSRGGPRRTHPLKMGHRCRVKKICLTQTRLRPTNPSTLATDSAGSRAVEEDDKELQIRTFRLEVLKVGATLVRHGRYVTFYIAHTAVVAWERFWTNFKRFHWQTLTDL